MPHAEPHKAEQPAALVPAQGVDTEDVSRIDTAALWQAICRISGDYIAVVDRTGTIRFCNRVDDGWSPEQVMGRSMLDFTLPESTEQLYRVIEDVFATGREQTTETTVRRPDGSLNYFLLRLGPVLVDGRTAAILVCCENILPLKTSEKSLQHERNLLRRLLKIQERERQLVSYEIHDGLAQYLAGAMMQLEACEHGLGGSAKNRELGEGLRLLRAAADEARRLIGGLRPPALDETSPFWPGRDPKHFDLRPDEIPLTEVDAPSTSTHAPTRSPSPRFTPQALRPTTRRDLPHRG
jgi:PAS domain S-box-containing protein